VLEEAEVDISNKCLDGAEMTEMTGGIADFPCETSSLKFPSQNARPWARYKSDFILYTLASGISIL
jgi:hypothetical protein